MHKITIYPLGNADSCLLELENKKFLLFDFGNQGDPEDEKDLRADLEAELRQALNDAKRNDFDVVAFTHADDDHVHGAKDFFYLEHAKAYQSGERPKIKELWVPAAMILEDGLDDDARVLRQEARHRLKNGKGIRVFSRPEALKDWLKAEGLTLDSRKHLITNAGEMVPGYADKATSQIEFFVHSPFSKHADEGQIDRNTASLVVQGTFDTDTKLLLAADTTWEVWEDIVQITKAKKNDARLHWDVYKLPHHCSYRSLAQDKGKTKTIPGEHVQWLLDQGQTGAVVVSTSDPIPASDTDQPPHRQAYATYKEQVAKIDGEIVVTMEHPSVKAPEKLVIEIDSNGARVLKRAMFTTAIIAGKPAPRAGSR